MRLKRLSDVHNNFFGSPSRSSATVEVENLGTEVHANIFNNDGAFPRPHGICAFFHMPPSVSGAISWPRLSSPVTVPFFILY